MEVKKRQLIGGPKDGHIVEHNMESCFSTTIPEMYYIYDDVNCKLSRDFKMVVSRSDKLPPHHRHKYVRGEDGNYYYEGWEKS